MTHLQLLNALLALRFKQPGWPTLLAQFAYIPYGIGVGFELPDGSLVNPDFLCASTIQKNAILFEVKGGASFDGDQLNRMLKVTAEVLRDYAFLSIPDAQAFKVSTVILCNPEQLESFTEQAGTRPVTLLAFDGRRFLIEGAPLADFELQAALLSATVTRPVSLGIIPYDRESSLGEIARNVLPEIVATLLQSAGAVSPEGLLRKTHALVYDAMAPTGAKSERAEILNRITEVLKEAAANELKDWLERAGQQRVWRFKKDLGIDPTTRTRDLKNLQTAAKELVERLGGQKGIQLLLFEDPNEPTT